MAIDDKNKEGHTRPDRGGAMIDHGLSPKRVWLVMSGLMLSLFLSALDNAVVGTAMPKIIRDLNGMEHYAWPFTSYMLLSTAVVPIAGKLADVYGQKGISVTGIAIFIVGSALCGLSADMTQLVIFRGFQGIGGGIIFSNSLIIVAELFPHRERGKYMGLLAGVFALANLVGPTIGGFIADHLSWRWVFYVNLPFGFASFFILLASLPRLKYHERKRQIDLFGMVAFLLAVFPFLVGFSEGGKGYPWFSSQIMGLFAFSAVMFAVFIYRERRSPEPLLSLDLFKGRVFTVSVVSSFLGSAGMFGAIIFAPLFAQSVLGASATGSGLITTPMMVGMMAASTATGLVVSRFNRYLSITLVGYVLALLGMVVLAAMGSQVSSTGLSVTLLILGIGFGITVPVLMMAPQNVAPPGQLGVVTSAINFFRNLGGTVASAILGSVMLSSMEIKLKALDTASLPTQIRDLIKDPGFLSNVQALEKVRGEVSQALVPTLDAVIGQARNALAVSIQSTFIVGVFVLLAASAVAVFLDEKRAREGGEERHSLGRRSGAGRQESEMLHVADGGVGDASNGAAEGSVR